VDIVCNWIGLHSRMNYGQVRECLLGRVARARGEAIVAPPLHGPDGERIRGMLRECGLPEDGMERLTDGKGGPALRQPSLAGHVYWGLTWHRTKVKKLVWHDATDAVPLGEQEYYALRDVGAYRLTGELFNTLSCRREGVASLPERVARGELPEAGAPSPAFSDLRRRLAALGVGATLDKQGLRLALTESEGDTVKLARPVPHPWLPERELGVVGALPQVDGYGAVVDANDRLGQMLSGDMPREPVARASERLQSAVHQFAAALVTPEHMRPGGPVAFSGANVITPGRDLRYDQVGLPDGMAWELFGPMVTRVLHDPDAVARRTTAAVAKLDETLANSWVLVNRGPTLSSTYLLALHPVRHDGPAVRLHPMCTAMMNADFDGDQVALFVPVTPAAQRDAGEKLSLAGHLTRDPELVEKIVPTQDALWGLAALSLESGGAERIAQCAGFGVCRAEPFLTRGGLVLALKESLKERGVSSTLDTAERLMHLGFEEAKRSGASFDPFADTAMPRPPSPPALEYQACAAAVEDVCDIMLAKSGYGAGGIGPQLLAVKSGARGNARQLVMGLSCRFIRDVDATVHFYQDGLLRGMEAKSVFVQVAGARRGLVDLINSADRLAQELRETSAPSGYAALARAIRSRSPGKVLARAAAAGEVDALTDIDARLFVGLMPQ
jgi:hypothetical protein